MFAWVNPASVDSVSQFHACLDSWPPGETKESILKAYPYIEAQDIEEALLRCLSGRRGNGGIFGI